MTRKKLGRKEDRNPKPDAEPLTDLTKYAYDRICAAIVFGRLDFGEPLSESELASALDIGKAPVRSALGALKAKGLVDVVAQSGTYVFSPTSEDVEALCEFRFILEEQAVHLAMASDRKGLIVELRRITRAMQDAFARSDIMESKKLDTGFHWSFVRRVGNRYLVNAYSDISFSVEALRYRFMDTVTYRNKAFSEHERIVDFLEAGQITRAIEILRAHVNRTKKIQTTVIWSGPRAQRKLYRLRDYSTILNSGVELDLLQVARDKSFETRRESDTGRITPKTFKTR